MEYKIGDEIEFECMRSAVIYGNSYEPGQTTTITLAREWDGEEGLGEGGPWGWGGFSSRFLKSLERPRKD